MSGTRSIWFIGAGIGALVLVVTAVVLLAGGRSPQTFPPDSPQGVVQRYLAAWDAEDLPAAYGFLSARVHATVSQADYERAVNDNGWQYARPGNGGATRVYFDSVREDGDRATVNLRVDQLSGDGLNTTVYSSSRSVALVRDPEGWRIDEPLLWLEQGPFPAPEAPLK